jgi:hypothetical protein
MGPILPIAASRQPRVHAIAIGGNWTTNGSIHLVLAQLKRSTDQVMISDGRRSHAVTALTALFTDPRSITEHLLDGGNSPRVVVAPELAIGSGDWADVDDAVQRSRGDTLLVVGCGFVSGRWIQDWLTSQTSPSTKLAAWPVDGELIATARPYNIGFAWIKTAAGSQCVLFLKNFPDQSGELGLIPDLANGQWMLRLDADDLIIFPTICSDLQARVDSAGNPASAATRIKQSLNTNPANGRKILITGSLLTPKPGHAIWNRASVHCAETVGPGHILVLANASTEVRAAGSFLCFPSDEEDGWRNRTGVFKPRPTNAEQDRSPGKLTLLHNQANLVAVVARETFALIQGGSARWEGSITHGAYLWHSTGRAILDAAGAITRISCDEPLAHEVARLALRRKAAVEPNPAHAGAPDPLLRQQHECARFRFDNASMLATTLCFPDSPWPARLMRTILCGLDSATVDIKPFTDNPAGWPQLSHLYEGLDAAALVLSVVAENWQLIPDFDDRAMHQSLECAFVVWSSPFHSRLAMERAISTWQSSSADASNVVVIGQSRNHEFGDGTATQPLAREDIGQPEPAMAQRDITAQRRNREVTHVRLGRLLEACEPVVGGNGDVRGRVLNVLGIAERPAGVQA